MVIPGIASCQLPKKRHSIQGMWFLFQSDTIMLHKTLFTAKAGFRPEGKSITLQSKNYSRLQYGGTDVHPANSPAETAREAWGWRGASQTALLARPCLVPVPSCRAKSAVARGRLHCLPPTLETEHQPPPRRKGSVSARGQPEQSSGWHC